LVIVATSVLFLHDKVEWVPIEEVDEWSRDQAGRRRLLNLILESPVPVAVLSGDSHRADIHETECWTQGKKRTIVNFMSSGLSVNDINHAEMYGLSVLSADYWISILLDLAWWSWSLWGEYPYRVESYPWENFGRVHVAHEHLTFTAFSDEGVSVFSRRYAFDDLRVSAANVRVLNTPQEIIGKWECYPSRPTLNAMESRYYASLRVWYYLVAPLFQIVFIIFMVNRCILARSY